MHVKVAHEGDKATVYLSGTIDIPSAELLKNTLYQVVDKNANDITVDFKEVGSIGSSGIGALLLCHKEFHQKGVLFHIVNVNKEIKSLFKIIKLDKLFNI